MHKELRIIFYASAIISAIGHLIDLIQYHSVNSLLIHNSIYIALIIGLIILYENKKKYLQHCLFLVLYLTLFSLFIGLFKTDNHFNTYFSFFLRESMFIILLMLAATLFLNKIHAVIIGVIYLIVYVGVILVISDNDVNNNAPILLTILCSYSVLIYFFSGKLDRLITKLEKDNREIITKHNKVVELNTRLVNESNKVNEKNIQIATKNELLVKQDAELKKANATKDRFFSIIAHDLKNPLHSLINLNRLFKERFKKLSNEKREYYLEQINSSTENLYELLQNLLLWSRTQSGIIKINKQKIKIKSLIDNTLDALTPNTVEKLIKVKVQVNDNDEVWGDEHMLQTVLRNIIGNAVKYSYQAGTIDIKTLKQNNHITISVQDYGIGMPEEIANKVFDLDRDFRKDGTLGEVGTGLGLIISKDFINLLDGEIGVKSDLNLGTEFWISLKK